MQLSPQRRHRNIIALAAIPLLAGASALSCTSSDGTPKRPAGDSGPISGDATVEGDSSGQLLCSGTADFIAVGDAQRLDTIVESPSRCLLYAADSASDTVYLIDTVTDSVRVTVAVGNQPSDLVLSADGSELYVAVLGEQLLVALDAETGAIVDTIATTRPPFRLARGPLRQVFYVPELEDPAVAFAAIHRVDFASGEDTQATGIIYHEPDLASSADGLTLYVGEANQPGSRLFRLDASETALPEVDRYRFDGGFGLPSPERHIHLAETADRIYFADRGFSASNLTRVRGWIGSQVRASTPDSAIVATRDALYDAETYVRFANRPYPGLTALFSADGHWLYGFSPVGSLLRRTSVETLVGVYRLGATNVPPGSLAQHNFSQLLADPVRPIIYALDAQQNQLVFIDINTLLPYRSEIIGSSPTDMSLHPDNNTMAVATFGATEVAIVDLNDEQKALKNIVAVRGNPFRVALSSADRMVYVEQDQFSDMTLVDMTTGNILATLESIFQADVEFDPTGRYLYAGESAGGAARLRRFDLITEDFDEISATTDSYSYPARKVIYNSGFVYYAGRKFDALTLEELGNFGEEIVLVTPDGKWAVSPHRIYRTSGSFDQVGGLPAASSLLTVGPNSEIIYQFDNSTGALFVQPLPAE